MAAVELDFYEPDGTTLIGTLDDSELLECEARPALQELGALKFTVSRHLAAASSALLAKGNYVKYRIPSVDADPIALFVLKDDQSKLIDKDEEGGEHLEVTGPGALWVLQHARLREEVYAPGQPARGDWDDDVSWNWRARAYGAILVRVIEEGQNQPGSPLAAIAIDFDRDVDSDGNPWYVIAEDFNAAIGTDVLTVANRLAAGGDLFLSLTPDMVLHAYQSVGRNLTGSFASDNVRFEKGVNILTELNRKSELDRVTHLITRDSEGVYRTFVTPDPYDQAVYGFLEVGWTNDADQVEKTALQTLATSDDAAEVFALEVTPGFAPAAGEYMPGPEGTDGHFWPGDLTTLHTGSGEHDLNAATVRVAAVSIVLDEAADDATDQKAARSFHIVPELVLGTPGPQFSGVGNGPGANGPGCVCLKLCNDALVGAASVVDTVGAEETIGVGGFLLDFVDFTALPNAAIYVAHGFRSDVGDPTITWKDAGGTIHGTFTKLVGQVAGGGITGSVRIYRLLNPDPAGDRIHSTAQNVGYWVVRDRDPASTDATGANSGTGTTPNVTVTAPGALILRAFHTFTNSADPSGNPTATDQTQSWADFGNDGNPGSGDQEFAGATGGSGNAGWVLSGASQPWAAVGVSVSGQVIAGCDPILPVGANDESSHGTQGGYAARIDHVHPHSDLSDHDDETHHHAGSIEVTPFETITSTDLQSALEEMFNEITGVTDHGALTGLADNDHPQYLLAADAPTTAGDLTTRWIPLTVYDPTIGNYLPLVDGSGNQLMAEGS